MPPSRRSYSPTCWRASQRWPPIQATSDTPREVYGDAWSGTAEVVEKLESAGVAVNVKVQLPAAREGMFSQEAFTIDTANGEVSCPAGKRVVLRVLQDGSSHASFGDACGECSLKAKCTKSKSGRSIKLHPKHNLLDRHRKRQRDEAWKANYGRSDSRVERKIGHIVRRKHGGRRARMRGIERLGQDFAMLAASINLARLAALGMPCRAPREGELTDHKAGKSHVPPRGADGRMGAAVGL